MKVKSLHYKDISQDIVEKVLDIICQPDLERPDGSPCFCNPEAPNWTEDFGTHSLFGVCDGEGKEVENHSIAEALSAIARAQMLLGVANYSHRDKEASIESN